VILSASTTSPGTAPRSWPRRSALPLPEWAQSSWSTVFGVISAVGAVGLRIGGIVRRPALFSFFERLIYVGFIGWFFLIGFTGLTV